MAVKKQKRAGKSQFVELDAKMVRPSEEFAKRSHLYEEESFALKTAEADYQSKIESWKES